MGDSCMQMQRWEEMNGGERHSSRCRTRMVFGLRWFFSPVNNSVTGLPISIVLFTGLGVQYFGLWGWWWRMKGWEIGITIENENSGGAVLPHKLLLSFAPACYNNNAKPCHFSFKTSIGYWIDQWYYFFLISMFLLVIAFSTRTSNKFGKKGK